MAVPRPDIDPARNPASWATHVPPAERAAVLRTFIGPDGGLRQIPAKHSKRLIVLDLLAGQFTPGQRYTEVQVNAILRGYHDDVAALRRYLVENGFMDREAGWYWRIGGSLEPSDPL